MRVTNYHMINDVVDTRPRRDGSYLGRGLSLARFVWSIAMVLVVSAVGFSTSGGKVFSSNLVGEVGVSQETTLSAQNPKPCIENKFQSGQ